METRVGSGEFEWRGYLSRRRHAQGINPRSGKILNWNNKPARGFAASDDNFAYGSAHRVQLLEQTVAGRGRHTLTSLVAAMNRAATQDLRAVVVLPQIAAVLEGGPAPRQGCAHAGAAEGVASRRRAARPRLDGRSYPSLYPGRFVAGPDAIMAPVLARNSPAWPSNVVPTSRPAVPPTSRLVGYVDKACAACSAPVQGASARSSRRRHLAGCRASLWRCGDRGAELARRRADPGAWRANAQPDGCLRARPARRGEDVRWTDRPTFHRRLFRGTG